MHFYESNMLYRIAVAACARTDEAASDESLEYGQDTIVAVVFAAIAIEAFIREAGIIARHDRDFCADEKGLVSAFGEAMEAMGDRANMAVHFTIAGIIFGGEAPQWGANTFQNLKLLIDLRNHLVHLRPRESLVENEQGQPILKPADILEKLRSKNVLTSILSDTSLATWTMRIGTRKMARWACTTSCDCAEWFTSKLPQGRFREVIGLIADGFVPYPGRSPRSYDPAVQDIRHVHITNVVSAIGAFAVA